MIHNSIIIGTMLTSNEQSDQKVPVSTAFYIKTVFISFLLLIESNLLTREILIYISKRSFFSTDYNSWIIIIILLAAIAITIPLTTGAWSRISQYLIVPIPLTLGLIFAITFMNPKHIAAIALAFFLSSIAFMLFATDTKNKLIVFDPVIIFSRSIRSFMFMYAVLGGFLLFLNTSPGEDFNIIDSTVDIVSNQIVSFIKPQVQTESIGNRVTELIQKIYGQNLNPQKNFNTETQSILNEFGISNIDKSIKDEINSAMTLALTPYKTFILPFMAIMVFALMEFLGFIARIVFFSSAKPLVSLAKSIGFLHIEMIQVEKEELTF